MIISQINWSPSETLFEIGGFSVYVYSLMFILAFLIGYNLVKSFFVKENVDDFDNIPIDKRILHQI